MLWHSVQGAGGTIGGGGGGVISYYVGGTGFELATSTNLIGTFSSLDIGSAPTASQKRYVVVCQGGASFSVNRDISATDVTVAGLSCTLAVEKLAASTSYKQYAAVHYVEVPTGTTATVSITSAYGRGFSAQVYSVYIDSGDTLSVYSSDTDEASTALSCAVNAPATNSVAAAAAQFRNGEATPSISFGGTLGLTTDYRVDILSDENSYFGSDLLTSSGTGLTATITDSGAAGNESVLVSAVFSAS